MSKWGLRYGYGPQPTAADFRIPDQEPIRRAEDTGTATLRMGRYLHMMDSRRLNALKKELLGTQTIWDTPRHIDDRVERCQEDTLTMLQAGQDMVRKHIDWVLEHGKGFDIVQRDPGDEQE